MKKKTGNLSLPGRLLSPIKVFLEKELVLLKRRKKQLKKNDPFFAENRANENSFEEDLDEQIGHFDNEVKAKFLSKEIVQFRTALTRMKIGKYGICEKCGKMIDTDRLAVQPEATMCIKCSKKSEE
ncbi:MAG: TraR/DksA C4-type zinc finger protein [Candidatus Shapirobacteria bacterium]|nr:TraR/DksA C4-type zinc finger protein [Candidatus Shapirobacteria bacterium]MDD4410348.1 TraR/DksA C4-type zinc finger protein [Candidatus Shapirobacteria bacterium]